MEDQPISSLMAELVGSGLILNLQANPDSNTPLNSGGMATGDTLDLLGGFVVDEINCHPDRNQSITAVMLCCRSSLCRHIGCEWMQGFVGRAEVVTGGLDGLVQGLDLENLLANPVFVENLLDSVDCWYRWHSRSGHGSAARRHGF
jgi:hypothetical protein